MNDIRERILRFLRSNIWNDKRPVSKFVLRHIAAGGKIGAEVSDFEAINSSMTIEDIEALAVQIITIAQDDQDGIGGIQKYAILAYRKEDDKQSSGRCIFTISSDSVTEFEGELDSEPPTQKGITSQLMRHNEALMRINSMGFQAIMTSQQRIIGRLSEQNEHLSAKHYETIELVEALMSGKANRELEEKKLELKQKFQTEAFENAKMLMPVIVNKITGKKILPENVSSHMMALKQFLSTLKQEQVDMFMQFFTPAQRIAFMDMYNTMRDTDDYGTPKNGSHAEGSTQPED